MSKKTQQSDDDLLICSQCQDKILLLRLHTIQKHIVIELSCNQCNFKQVIRLKDFVQSLKHNKLPSCIHTDTFSRDCFQSRKVASIQAKKDKNLVSTHELVFAQYYHHSRDITKYYCSFCQGLTCSSRLTHESKYYTSFPSIVEEVSKLHIENFFSLIEEIKGRNKLKYDIIVQALKRLDNDKVNFDLLKDLEMAYLRYEIDNQMIEELLELLRWHYELFEKDLPYELVISIKNIFRLNNTEVNINEKADILFTIKNDCFNLNNFFTFNHIITITPQIQNATVIEAHQSEIKCMIILNNGNFATGARDCLIMIWDHKLFRCEKVLKEHKNAVFALLQLKDNRLASGSLDNTIKLWDHLSWNCLHTLTCHFNGVYCLLQLNDTLIASGSEDSTIKISSIVSYENVFSLEEHFRTVRCLIKGKESDTFISGSDDSRIILWSIYNKEPFKRLLGHKGMVICLLLLSDGRLASSSCDATIIIWDLHTSKGVGMLQLGGNFIFSMIQWSNNMIITGSYLDVIIWDVRNMKPILAKNVHNHNISGLIKVNDHTLVSCSSDYCLKVSNL